MKHTMFRKRLFIYFGLFILLILCITEGLMQGYTSYSPVQLYEGVLHWVQDCQILIWMQLLLVN